MIRRLWLRLILALLPRSVVAELPEDQVQFQLTRGRRAKDLLADEVLTEAFKEIEAGLTKQWAETPSHQSEAREVLFHQVAALQSVRAQLTMWAGDATLIAARIEKRR